MFPNTFKILALIIPGLIAILGNIIFYAIIKNRIDKSIERHKISYAGIYKEKIEIHKNILKQIFDLKLKIQKYQYSGNKDLGKELFSDFTIFINTYKIGQPFLKKEIFDRLVKLTEELKGCFDNFYEYSSLSEYPGIDPEIRIELLKKFFESGNKFKKDEPFKETEKDIVAEMRKDLKIEEL